MIGTTISHYKILEKPPTSSGQVGEGGMSENGPRTLYVSGCRFQDPRLTLQIRKGGQAPSFALFASGQAPSFALFASAGFLAEWRRREL